MAEYRNNDNFSDRGPRRDPQRPDDRTARPDERGDRRSDSRGARRDDDRGTRREGSDRDTSRRGDERAGSGRDGASGYSSPGRGYSSRGGERPGRDGGERRYSSGDGRRTPDGERGQGRSRDDRPWADGRRTGSEFGQRSTEDRGRREDERPQARVYRGNSDRGASRGGEWASLGERGDRGYTRSNSNRGDRSGYGDRGYGTRGDGAGENRGGDRRGGEARGYRAGGERGRDDRGRDGRASGRPSSGQRSGYQGERSGYQGERSGYQGERSGYQGYRPDGRGESRGDDRNDRRSSGRPDTRRDDRGQDRFDRSVRDDRPRRDEEDFVRPGLAAREDEPETPTEIDEKMLPFSVRAELRGLPKDLSHIVAAHLVAAGELIDEDPALAYRHAEAARRRAARLPVVREATAETAYAAGEYAAALNEYRALRRMTGGADYLPVMADCERALGRPENALRLAREAQDQALDPVQRVEMLLVEAGARDDLGQSAEAARLLKNAIGEKGLSKLSQARLRYAYADLLERQGNAEAAREWFVSAGHHDSEQSLDVAERINRLDGVVIEADLEEDDESQETPEPQETPEHEEDQR